MNEKIISYIKDEVTNEAIDHIDANEDLLGSGIIDSIGLIKLISFLEQEYQISIPPEDMTVENFMTPQSITEYILKLKDQ